MWSYLRDLLTSSPKRPIIKGLQLEVSTLCQLSCRYCPRTQATGWPNQFMSWDIYQSRLYPYFNLFEMIFLQGWGEPLTNPHFWDMVELAKSSGRQVGFVTNGILLTQDAADRACELDVDLISFTFTGASSSIHEFYRNGASFSNLQTTIRMLADSKMRHHMKKPVIGISFTMMRENLHEFPAVVQLAAELGVNQVTASHMDCMPSKDIEKHAVFLSPMPDDLSYITRAAHIANSSGLVFKSEPPKLSGEILACEPNPLRMTLFVRADGTVVPCHQMALPPGVVREFYFHGAPCEYQPLSLGNVSQETLPAILSKPLTRNIFEIFGARIDCEVSSGQQIPDAPEFCKKCYKLYGA